MTNQYGKPYVTTCVTRPTRHGAQDQCWDWWGKRFWHDSSMPISGFNGSQPATVVFWLLTVPHPVSEIASFCRIFANGIQRFISGNENIPGFCQGLVHQSGDKKCLPQASQRLQAKSSAVPPVSVLDLGGYPWMKQQCHAVQASGCSPGGNINCQRQST